MELEDFRRLLQQGEGPTLDYKRELYLDDTPRSPEDHKIVGALDKKRRGELAKDAMALANAFSHWGPKRYLVIGVEDDGWPDGIQPGAINEQLIAQALEDYCTPPVHFLYEEIQVGNMYFGLITIPDSPLKPHRFSKDIHYVGKKKTRGGPKSQSVRAYEKDDVWIRIGSQSRLASPEEIIRLREEAKLTHQASPLPPPIEAAPGSLEGILCKDAPDFFDKLWSIKKQVQERYVPRFPSSIYVGEPREHCQTVTERLNELAPLSVMEAMSCDEIFVLLGAVQLHEIGMITDSEDPEIIKTLLDTFHSHTRRMILQECEPLDLSKSEATAIGYLCYGHRGEGILDVPEERPIGLSPQPARLQLLAALFRLAHALDLDQKLAVLFRNEGVRYVKKETPLRISIEPGIWGT